MVVTNQIKQDKMLIQIPILLFKTHYHDHKSNYNCDNYRLLVLQDSDFTPVAYS